MQVIRFCTSIDEVWAGWVLNVVDCRHTVIIVRTYNDNIVSYESQVINPIISELGQLLSVGKMQMLAVGLYSVYCWRMRRRLLMYFLKN
jgi:hypothetical protein